MSHETTLVPQEPDIFTTTIWENVSVWIGRDPHLVYRYVDAACFRNVVERLPKKFDSMINEKGVNLSVGEKQRLALARGLLASDDKSIVLLDEPTSSLDVETEMEIYRNIFEVCKGKAVISSIHRLHLLPLFDRIYFFENGKVIAEGTFAELIANSKEFFDLWQKYSAMVASV